MTINNDGLVFNGIEGTLSIIAFEWDGRRKRITLPIPNEPEFQQEVKDIESRISQLGLKYVKQLDLE